MQKTAYDVFRCLEFCRVLFRSLVTNAADRSVTVIHAPTGTVVENVLLNTHPIGIATSRDGRLAFVAGLDPSGAAGEISVLDLKRSEERRVGKEATQACGSGPTG